MTLLFVDDELIADAVDNFEFRMDYDHAFIGGDPPSFHPKLIVDPNPRYTFRYSIQLKDNPFSIATRTLWVRFLRTYKHPTTGEQIIVARGASYLTEDIHIIDPFGYAPPERTKEERAEESFRTALTKYLEKHPRDLLTPTWSEYDRQAQLDGEEYYDCPVLLEEGLDELLDDAALLGYAPHEFEEQWERAVKQAKEQMLQQWMERAAP